MKPGTKKTVRVATTFTGAAACAFTFAPAAHGGTAQPTAQPGHQPRRIGNLKKVVPGIHYAPDTIHMGSCLGTDRSHWFHIGSGVGNIHCWGGIGKANITSLDIISEFCGGNNSGWIKGYRILNFTHRSIHFAKGTTYRTISPLSLSFISISTFGGTDKCPSLA